MEEAVDDKQIVIEATRIASQYGRDASQYQRNGIIQLVRDFVREGMRFEVAVEYATTLVLLHGVEDPPWR